MLNAAGRQECAHPASAAGLCLALPPAPPYSGQALICVAQVARTAADCKMEMDVEEYVDSFRPGGQFEAGYFGVAGVG